MKTLRKFTPTLAGWAATIVIVGLTGCASSNYEKGSSAAAGMTESAEKVAIGKGKIDTTLAALNELVNNPQGDLVPRFKKYTDAVGDLQSTAEHVRDSVASMRDKGNEYFKAWDQQVAAIKNEEIKNRSVERKQQMHQKFMDIKRSYIQAGDAFKPFMSDLKDIQTALSTDLTSGGVAAVKGPTDKANKDAGPVKAAIEELAKHFRDLGAAMATGGGTAPAPQPAPTK